MSYIEDGKHEDGNNALKLQNTLRFFFVIIHFHDFKITVTTLLYDFMYTKLD